MKSQKIPRKSRAVSPVIATVIQEALAITVAVAVSYWMSGISSQYTQFEKVEIQTAICTLDTVTGNWQIEVKMKNSGSKSSTLTNVFVSDVEVSEYGDTDIPDLLPVGTITTDLTIDPPFSISSGDTGTIFIQVGAAYGTLSSGTTVNIKIHSAGGMDYIKLVQLV